MSKFINLFQSLINISIFTDTARKTMFSFSKCFEKKVFPKKFRWNMIFLALSGKMMFLFLENMILFFRHKRKDDLSQKTTCKYDIFLKCSEKMVFPKNSRLNTIFFVISGKMVFLFSRKYIFSLGRKWKKLIFIKKCVQIWYFLYICVGVQAWHCPPDKKTKMSLKSTPKGDISRITEKDDIHPRFILISAEVPHSLTS